MSEHPSLRQQQHRLLQHQVHQQLQRIYGDASEQQQTQSQHLKSQVQQEPPGHAQQKHHHNQQFHHHHHHPHHQQSAERHKLLLKRQRQQQYHLPNCEQKQQQQHHHHHHHPSHHHHNHHHLKQQPQQQQQFEEQEFNLKIPGKDYSNRQIKQQHLLMFDENNNNNNNNNDNEQNYNELNGLSSTRNSNSTESFYDVRSVPLERGVPRVSAATSCQPPIDAIPEECYDERDDDDHDDHPPPKRRSEQIDGHSNGMVNSTKTTIEQRKNQLEDLHYATVTAAALLSATANAAAAFAAGNGLPAPNLAQYGAQDPREFASAGRTLESTTGSFTGSAFQGFPRKPQVVVPAGEMFGNQHHTTPTYQQHHHHQQQPIYSVNMMNSQAPRGNPQRAKLVRASSSSGASGVALHSPLIRTTGNQQLFQNQPQPHQAYGILTSTGYPQQQQEIHQQQHQHRQLLPSRVQNQNLGPYLEPSIASVYEPIGMRQNPHHGRSQSMSVPAQQQLMTTSNYRSLAPGQLALQSQMGGGGGRLPALTYMQNQQRDGKGRTGVLLRTDLLGRLLVNNLLAAQRITDESPAYAQRPTLESRAREVASKLMDGHTIVRRELLYNISNRNSNSKHVIGSSMHPRVANLPHLPITALAATTAASSDPQAPLVIDRNLKPLSFVERICRIDLTVFWWSLLMVSFLFVSGIVIVSRYIL